MFEYDHQWKLTESSLILVAVFTKLASQLTAEKLIDLAIIPFVFIVQTLISYLCAVVISTCFGFKKRQKNFVIAMGVRFPSPLTMNHTK
jgi:auxin efflux carrier family protein